MGAKSHPLLDVNVKQAKQGSPVTVDPVESMLFLEPLPIVVNPA